MGNPLELRSLSLAMNINHTQNKCTLYSLLVDTVSAREILIRYVRTKFEMYRRCALGAQVFWNPYDTGDIDQFWYNA